MEVRYFKFTVPMLEATAGALVEFDIPNLALRSARILGYRVVAPPVEGASQGGQGLGFGWRPGDNFIEAYSFAAPHQVTFEGTGGAHQAAVTLYIIGSLEDCVGDENVPLKVYYSNTMDVDQTGDIHIEVVVGYEVI